jgi:hypothetical protein
VSDLEKLLRWERAGGTWEVVGQRGEQVTISLCRCDGGEEAERFTTADPQVRAHIEAAPA